MKPVASRVEGAAPPDDLREQLAKQNELVLALQAKVDALGGGGGVAGTPAVVPPAAAAAAACGHHTLINATVAVEDYSVHHTQVSIAAPVTINVFGQEDTAHLTPQAMGALLDGLREGAPDGQRVIVSVVREIYGDPKRPENITCYTPNSKRDAVLVHSETGWKSLTGKEVFPEMMTRACTELNDKQDFYADLELLEERSKQVRAAFDCETQCKSADPVEARRARAQLARSLQTVMSGNKAYLLQGLERLPRIGGE